jgi:hypothetical protein
MSKVYNVASSILGVNCGVGGSLIKKKTQTISTTVLVDYLELLGFNFIYYVVYLHT